MRADAVVTATYLVTLAAPIAAYASFRHAHRGDHDRHRLMQGVLVGICWIAVLALEIRIRLAGGSGAMIEGAPDAARVWAQRLLIVHVGVAIATYIAWTWLAIASWRRYERRLPGSFSRRHRLFGTLVFAGLCFTAGSATGMYVLTFVVT